MRTKDWIIRHFDACALALYAILSIPLTYPLILHLADSVPGHGADDPYLAWNIWWVKTALIDLATSPLFTNYIFYPIGVNLGTYTLTLLNGLISIPLQIAWDVIPANDLVVLFSLTIGAFGAFLLTTEVLGREAAPARTGALAAGLIYGFGSYRFNYLYLGHFNFNSNEWLPFYILYLTRIFRMADVSPRAGILAGLFLVFAGWTESTFIAFLALFSGCYLLFRLAAERLQFFRRPVIYNLGALAVVAAAGLSPLIIAVASDLARYGNFLSFGPQRAEFLSADLLSFLIPSQFNPLLGWSSQNLSYHNMDFAFVGYVSLLLAVIGFVALRTRAVVVFWGIAALVFATIMLGPVIHINNAGFNLLPMPYRLIQSIPLLGANRLPVRYDHLVMLSIAVLSGGGTAIILTRFRGYQVLYGLIPVLLLVEHSGIPLSMSNLAAPLIYHTIAADQGQFSVLDLPISWSSSTAVQGELYTQSQFYQTVHHKSLLGGNTSRPPPFQFQYFNRLPVLHTLIQLENGGTVDGGTATADEMNAPDLVRFFGIRYVIARNDKVNTPVAEYAKRVLHLIPIEGDGMVSAFRINIPVDSDFEIDPANRLSQMYYDDNWGSPQERAGGVTFRWATASGASVYLPLAPSEYQACGLFAGTREGQVVHPSLNGASLGTITLSTHWANKCMTVPATQVRPGMNELAFASDEVPLEAAPNLADRRIGETGVIAPVDVAVTSAGFLAGKFASISVNGRELYASKRGFYLLAIDPGGKLPTGWQAFDTFRDKSESARLVEFVNALAPGMIVAGAVSDEASQNLTEEAAAALARLGLSVDLRGRFRLSYAFIGLKGAAEGTSLEASDSNFPANVSVGKNVTRPTVTFALGKVQVEQVRK